MSVSSPFAARVQQLEQMRAHASGPSAIHVEDLARDVGALRRDQEMVDADQILDAADASERRGDAAESKRVLSAIDHRCGHHRRIHYVHPDAAWPELHGGRAGKLSDSRLAGRILRKARKADFRCERSG